MSPSRAALLSALLLAGCPRGAAPPADVAASGAGHPELSCPAGTNPRGLGPPRGLEVFCARADAAGVELRHGPAIQWHDPTTRAAEGGFYEGARHGAWTEWYPSGAVRHTGAYVRGLESGLWSRFYESGQKEAEGEMHEGAEAGHWIYWGENGLPEREGTFSHGVQDGTWVYYGPDGRPRTRRTYRDGRLAAQVEL